MYNTSKFKLAIFFTVIFMALVAAPTIILSFDNTVDVSSFYGISEEEEHQPVKLVFDSSNEDSNAFLFSRKSTYSIGYPFKTYSKPHLNLISPPPEFIL